MSPLVEAVEAGVCPEAIATECRKGTTTVLLDGAPTPHTVVDLDTPNLGLSQSRRCDYLFVADTPDSSWIAAIELKSRSFRAERVVEQLQAGTDLADEWLPDSVPVNFRPVLVHRLRTLGPHRRVALERWRVRFRGDRVKVRALSSGARLVAAFDAGLGEDGIGEREE